MQYEFSSVQYEGGMIQLRTVVDNEVILDSDLVSSLS
jgi:hypothetical protein